MRKHSLLLGTLAVLIACISVTMASRDFGEQPSIPKDCTAIIYTNEDPREILSGESPCIPCNRLVADLRAKYKIKPGEEQAPIVGTEASALFRLVKAPPQVKLTPLVVYYYDNGTKDYVNGYDGDHKKVVVKHPAFGGKGGAREFEDVYLVSDVGSGFSQRNPGRLLSFGTDGSIEPTDENTTPFIPDIPREKKQDQDQLAQFGFYTPFGGVGYNPYASNCSASSAYGSYATPYSSCGNGGGGGIGGGGGGDFYTPPQAYYRPAYQPSYGYSQPQYRQPVSYGGYNQFSGGQRRMICGPNGCYYVD